MNVGGGVTQVISNHTSLKKFHLFPFCYLYSGSLFPFCFRFIQRLIVGFVIALW